MPVCNEFPAAVLAPSTLAEERPVAIPYQDRFLTGSFAVPHSPRAVVVIANDHGYARHVPALRALARELRGGGLATLMVDVVAPDEEGVPTRSELLAARLDAARSWLENSRLKGLPLVLLGMGMAAPAALLSAAALPAHVGAVVACGPRPDSAGIALKMVSAPTLLIAHGPLDDIGLHMRALKQLRAHHDLIVLHDPGDPLAAAVDVAQAILGFLSSFGSSAGKAA
jgi:putative phosphoribosyl transferase